MRKLVILILLTAGLVAVYPATIQASSPPPGIAFVRDGDIWVMDANAGNARRLTTSDKPEGGPSWSPDGSAIAYLSGGQIWLMGADGTNPRQVPFTLDEQTMPGTDDPGTTRGINAIAWAPNGADIAVAAGSYYWDSVVNNLSYAQLYLVRPDGTNQRRLGPLQQVGGLGGIGSLGWRPDGEQLLMYIYGGQGSGHAVSCDVTSGEWSDLYPGRQMWFPTWSPDGRRIAAVVRDDSENRTRNAVVIDTQTGREVDLKLEGPSTSQLTVLTWSPDGKWLACSYFNLELEDIFLLSVDGTQSRLLMADATDPAWNPTASSPTPKPAATVTLKLSGLTAGAVKLGQIVTATGTVTPLSLAGSKVTLIVQMKKGATWTKVKTSSASSRPVGNYRWKYAPAVKGAYRMRAAIAPTDTYAAATTPWRAFTVK